MGGQAGMTIPKNNNKPARVSVIFNLFKFQMIRQIKKWTTRIITTLLVCVGFLLALVLNPALLYSNKTTIGNLTVYHNQTLNKDFTRALNNAQLLVKSSELYDNKLKLDICLNEGSNYTKLMKAIRGQAFAWGFYNKVVIMGDDTYSKNFVTVNGYRWNLTQLIAHEQIHCYQYNKFGFWNSNPVAGYPNWKWEGYPEYISRSNDKENNLYNNLQKKLDHEKNHTSEWEVTLNDGTITPKDYLDAWILVQYCLEVKKMTYQQLLSDTTSQKTVESNMLKWFKNQNKAIQ